MLIYLQLRSEWNSILPGCVIPNSHSSTINIIASLVIDVTLLLTVLAGLLRLRIQKGGAFGIGRLLWKQVWLQSFTCSMMSSVR